MAEHQLTHLIVVTGGPPGWDRLDARRRRLHGWGEA